MAKKETVEEIVEIPDNLVVDTDPVQTVNVQKSTSKKRVIEDEAPVSRGASDELISCLRKEIIQVRHIKRESGLINNPNHVFFGGMAETATRTFTVPILESSGQYVNVLTNSEKSFLEDFMGLPYNALSIYKKHDNYWDNFQVVLRKGETPLDLSDPNDYIKYKVLLANKDFIAPSLEALQDQPRATYQFVIVSDAEENRSSKLQLNATMEAYKEFGKIEDDFDKLKFVVETIGGRLVAANANLDFLHAQADKLIKMDARMFVNALKDPYLDTKVLIRRGVEAGVISKRGEYYYLKSDNSPLCESGQDPTLSIASKFLNLPKRQEIKFLIEAQINKQ